MDTSVIDRFISKFEIGGNCWVWNAGKTEDGYGVFWSGEKMVKAHRFSWNLYKGEIKDGLFVCHKCDNPSCVNPNHLFLGTNSDNMRDMRKKGRGKDLTGETNPNSKLNENSVREIRKLYRPGKPGVKSKYSIADLSRRYNVSSKTIRLVLNNKAWKEVLAV